MTAAGSLTGGRARLGRVPAIGLLLALLLATPLWAAPAGPPGLTVERCGAFAQEPGPGDPWPGAKAVRPDQTLLPGDKGLGCRFTLTGEPAGEAAVAEVRLTRPGPGGEPVEDRWFVPVRRGEAAVAVYGFAPGQSVAAGPWSLTLAADGATPATARFAGPAPAVGPGPALQAGPALPPAAVAPFEPALAPKTTSETVQAAAPLAPGRPADETPATPPVAAALQAVPAARAVAQSAAPVTAAPVAPPSPQSAAPARVKPVASTGYVALQTGLFTEADNAAAQAARLRSRGMPACVAAAGTEGKRRYRVLAGRFGDRRAAGDARAAVSAILGLSPLLYDVDAAEVARLRCR